MSQSGDDNFARVVLWTSPKCVSTAFEKSVRQLGNVKIFHELFTTSALLGEERLYAVHADLPVKPGYKFGDSKQMLERFYPGYRGVFAKEHAHWIIKTRRKDAIPDGFQHTFLIRRPIKAINSLYKMFTVSNSTQHISLGVGFLEMWELYKYIRDIKGQTPLVIDADDLLAEPSAMMKKFCDFVGFEFKEEMLHWEPGCVEEWDWDDLWYKTVASSTGFIKTKATEENESEIDITSLPLCVQEAIQTSQSSYDELYSLRMKP